MDPGDPSIDLNNLKEACAAEGTLINSGEFNGLNNRVAIDRFIDLVEKRGNRKEDCKLQTQRLAHIQTEILGLPYTYDILRYLRMGAGERRKTFP